jgi:hypothetical protein
VGLVFTDRKKKDILPVPTTDLESLCQSAPTTHISINQAVSRLKEKHQNIPTVRVSNFSFVVNFSH